MNPGKHRVKIALAGYQAFETEVNLLPHQKITIKTNLVPGSKHHAGRPFDQKRLISATLAEELAARRRNGRPFNREAQ